MVNEYTMLLLKAVCKSSCWNDAFERYGDMGSVRLTPESFRADARKVLDAIEQRARPVRKRLTISFTLLRHDVFAKIADRFVWLIKARSLAVVMVGLPIAMGSILTYGGAQSYQDSVLTTLIVSALVIFSVCIHELGHGAALRAHNQGTGNLGLGVYLVYPVLFVELFAHEALSAAGKIWVDVSGVYFQVLFGHAVALAALAFGSQELVRAAELIYVLALFQLIPVNKSDGFWIMSDTLQSFGNGAAAKHLSVVCGSISAVILAIVVHHVSLKTALLWTDVENAGGFGEIVRVLVGTSALATIFHITVIILLVMRTVAAACSSIKARYDASKS